jgi:hypothetical protein
MSPDFNPATIMGSAIHIRARRAKTIGGWGVKEERKHARILLLARHVVVVVFCTKEKNNCEYNRYPGSSTGSSSSSSSTPIPMVENVSEKRADNKENHVVDS